MSEVVNYYRAGIPGHTAPWVWVAYYLVSAYFVVTGLLYTATGLITCIGHPGQVISPVTIVQIVLGALSAVLGIGLLLKIQSVRNVVNFLCGVKIILGVLRLLGSIMVAFVLGPLGILFMFLTVVDIASAAFMIYLIGETDRVVPNI